METQTEEKKLTGLEKYRAEEKKKKDLRDLEKANKKKDYFAQKNLRDGVPAEYIETSENKQETKMTETEEFVSEKPNTPETVEAKVVGITNGELDYGIDPEKTYVFEPVVKSESPRHEMIGTECKIFDGSKIRMIRYVPMANTIYVDEMEGKFDNYVSPPLSFHRNQLAVEGKDARLVEYLLAHDSYDGNKHPLSPRSNKFTLVNKADLELTTEMQYKKELKAMNIINDTEIVELLPIARVVHNITDVDPRTVRNRLRAIAKVDPNQILDYIDSPIVRRSYVIQTAMDRGIIEFNADKRSVVWALNGGLIKEVMATKDSTAQVRELADFTFSTQGNRMYDVLKQKVAE